MQTKDEYEEDDNERALCRRRTQAMQLTSCRPQTSCGSGLKQLSAAALPAWLVSTSPSQLHAMLSLEYILRV